jgi:hypothetical protein
MIQRWRSIQYTTELVKDQDIHLIHAHLPRAEVLAGLAGSLTGYAGGDDYPRHGYQRLGAGYLTHHSKPI